MSEGISVTQATNFVIGIIVFIVAIAVALIIILSKKREEVQLTTEKRADANEKLLKARDVELEDCTKRCEKCKEELEDVTAELRAISGVKVQELIEWAKDYDLHMVKLNTAERRVRQLEMTLHLSDPPNTSN